MKLYLASANPGKARELQELADTAQLPSLRLEVQSASEIGGMPVVVEDTGSFVGNALKKARALAGRVPAGSWSLADDSGLCVDALGGAPGVESAYLAGPAGDAAANLAKLVELLRGVPEGKRSAQFVCVIALIGPDGREFTFRGDLRGRLIEAPRGSGGFGYDPLFVPEGQERTLAEYASLEKNRISHRARAFFALCGWLAGGAQTV